MSNKLFKTIITLSCFSLTSTPVLSNGIGDVFKNQNQARAGLYFRLPFAGGLKKSEKHELNYGFAMGFGRTQSGTSMMDARRSFNADIIKLNFNSKGFNSFKVGGQDIYRITRTRLGAVEGESLYTGTNLLYAAVGVGLIVLVVGELRSDKPRPVIDSCEVFDAC